MRCKQCCGASLLEILVSLLIVSISALGLTSIQASAKRVSFDAMQRSIATYLAKDIIERMRSNPAVLNSYVINNIGGGSITTQPTPDCNTSTCSNTQLAAHDLWEWERSLYGASESINDGGTTTYAGGLNAPRACITNAGGEVTVAIAWRGFQSSTNPTGSTCGTGLSLYDTGEAKRQLIAITTFIENI